MGSEMCIRDSFPDPESRELKEHCDILRQRRNECGLQSAKEIEALYPQFRTEQALEYAKDSGVLFKSGIMEALHQQAETAFQAPPPKKPGLDELLAWLDANHIPMAVASSSRVHVIEGNLNNWGLTHYFKALVSGQQVKHSKPDPEIFLTAAKALGTTPAETLVLEDSYNGVRAGAAGHFVTVMVPDMAPANDEMRRLYTAECCDLYEVLDGLQKGRF